MDINLKEKIGKLPDAPGVYIYKDAEGKIIYIGKAKSLKKRVGSYFTRFLSAKTQALVAKIADLEYILTPSETRAELLESVLIKNRQPYYNVISKDDKSFPLVRITNEEFPIVSICRRKKTGPEDKSTYYGPFTDPVSLRQALKVMRRIFGFRSCRALPKKPCLYFRLNLCPGPCAAKISHRQYQALIQEIKLFLESKYEELIDSLTEKMKNAAMERRFEEAAKIRDQVSALGVFRQSRQEFFGGLEHLQDILKLKGLPQRVEGFDIANISGKEAAGAMASFWQGQPDKHNYRKFRVKFNQGVDDYGMVREVVSRRYRRLKEEKAVLPDLILIDGGKGHLAAAGGVIRELGLDIPVISIAKEFEHIYAVGRTQPIKLKEGSPALNLLRRIRDEAHRFAQAYHHLLRRKKVIGK